MFEGQEKFFTAGFELMTLQGAGHFMLRAAGRVCAWCLSSSDKELHQASQRLRFQPSCARRAPVRLDSYRRGASLPSVKNASPARAERDIAVAEDVALDTTFAALLVFLWSLAFRGK